MTLGPLHISKSGQFIRKNDSNPDWPPWNVATLNTEHELRHAYAHLFAAAPDLLEACTAALDALNELIGAEYDVTGELAQCRNAIAKAKGE